MKNLLRTLAIVVVGTGLALAEGWGHDWEAAKAESKKTGRPILINLTGSDWCGWCIKLEKKVFSTETFKNYAAENLILMEADFPRKKEQPAEVKEQNEKLRKEYLAGGYPTVWLLDHEGKKLSDDLGEFGDDPGKWVAKLKELVAAAKTGKDA
jgi:thioredoxin-related protein